MRGKGRSPTGGICVPSYFLSIDDLSLTVNLINYVHTAGQDIQQSALSINVNDEIDKVTDLTC